MYIFFSLELGLQEGSSPNYKSSGAIDSPRMEFYFNLFPQRLYFHFGPIQSGKASWEISESSCQAYKPHKISCAPSHAHTTPGLSSFFFRGKTPHNPLHSLSKPLAFPRDSLLLIPLTAPRENHLEFFLSGHPTHQSVYPWKMLSSWNIFCVTRKISRKKKSMDECGYGIFPLLCNYGKLSDEELMWKLPRNACGLENTFHVGEGSKLHDKYNTQKVTTDKKPLIRCKRRLK